MQKMQAKQKPKAIQKNGFKILLFLLLLISTDCMNQMSDGSFVIDEKNREKTANNLQQNTESMKQNINSQVIKQNHHKQHMTVIDQQKTNTITEKKLQIIVGDSFQGVHELNEKNFQSFINQNRHTVVNFYTKECQYCDEFNKQLTEVQKKFTESNPKVIFATLSLSESTEKIFKSYNIDAVPEIKYFYQGKPVRYQYNFIQYSGVAISNLIEWIGRLSKVCEFQHSVEMSLNLNTIFGRVQQTSNVSLYIKEVQSLEQITQVIGPNNTNKRVIVLNCSYLLKETENKDLGEFLKHSFLTYLDHDFFCTQNYTIFNQTSPSTVINLPTTELILYVFQLKLSQTHQQTISLPTLRSRIHLSNIISYKLRSTSQQTFGKTQQYENLSIAYYENMKRYLYQNVDYWTNHSVLHVFTHNQPCFLMIINNETISNRLFLKFEEIKQQLTKNPNFPPIKFYYTDLSLTPQSATRIKKYISGLETSITKDYPFPLLAYLKPSQNRIKKYLYEEKVTSQGMEKWIVEIISKIQLQTAQQQVKTQSHDSQIQAQSDNLKVQEYFRSTPESLLPNHFTQLFREMYHSSYYSIEQKMEELQIPQNYIAHHNDLKLINFYDMEILLSDFHPKEFFVYVNWKNQIEAYELLGEIADWWYDLSKMKEKKKEKFIKKTDQNKIQNKISQEAKQNAKQELNINQKLISQHENVQQNSIQPQKKQAQVAEHLNQERKLIEKEAQNQKSVKNQVQEQLDDSLNRENEEQKLSQYVRSTNIYVLNFNHNDYPPVYWDSEGNKHQLEIHHVPSILYFSADRKVKDKIQGLSSIQQVQTFIEDQFSMQETKKVVSNQLASEQQKSQKSKNPEQRQRQLSGIVHNGRSKSQ